MVSKSTYTYWATLSNQTDGVVSLAFSPSGRFLAATGYAGVSIWIVAEQRAVPVPTPRTEFRDKHLYTRSTWLLFEESQMEVLLLGSKRGDVELWNWSDLQQSFVLWKRRKQTGTPSEVLAIDVYQQKVPIGGHALVVVSTADHDLTLFAVTAHAEILKKFSFKLDLNCRPQSVKFDSLTQTIVVFSRTGGMLVRYDCESGAKAGVKKDAPQSMASVALHPHGDRFVAYTGSSYEVVPLANNLPIQSIPCANANVLYPMYTAFGEDGSVLVAGTDNGHAKIYSMDTLQEIQRLNYPKGGLVQYVETATIDQYHVVAFAGSTLKRAADVILYRKQVDRGPDETNSPFFRIGRGHLLVAGLYWIALSSVLLYQYL
ncbi:WD40-repeat-containing domain protein [Schizophyllum commune]